MASSSIGLSALLALAVVVLYKFFHLKLRKHAPYPPGPPGDLLIGHVRFLARDQVGWFKSLRATYGNIVYLNVLGNPLIVFNNHKIAVDLLDKRGSSYSDRPRLVVIPEILGMTLFSALSYTKRTIRQRTMMTPLFTRNASKQYEPSQIRESHVLMANLLANPQNFMAHVRRFTTAVSIEIAYGHRVTRDDDIYVERAERFSKAIFNSGPPGATPPDILPILKYIPAWVPGAWWSQYGKRERPTVRAIIDGPFEDVLRQMAEGTASPSFMLNVMETLQSAGPVSEEDAEDVKESASLIYAAGAETTWSTINIFFFAMLMYPEVQKRAQRELDNLIGLDVLPSFNDRESLPYLESLLQEFSGRYYPTRPLGGPHFTKDEDIFENMYIPRGCTVIANTYGEPHPPATFGYGRRVCLGQWMAEANVWLVMAHTLAMFDIKRAIGKDGNEILPDTEFAFGFVSAPKPFICNIVPRSKKSAKAIEQAIAGH